MLKTAIFIAFTIFCKTSIGSNVDDECRINSELGKCKLLKNCQRAKDDLNFRSIPIRYCPEPSYVGLNPIVCCLPNSDLPDTIPLAWRGLPINERKCREYYSQAKYNFVTHLSSNSISQSRGTCVTGIPIIAGGADALEKEFPHMAIIGYSKEDDKESAEYDYKCAGSLVSDLFVLSAAHCNGGDYDEIPRVALFGVLKLSDASHRQVRQIADVIYNEENFYAPDSKLHDIILFKLNASVIFNDYVIPVCLPSVNQEIGTQFLASGWGQTNINVFRNDHLLKVLLTTSDKNECSTKFKNFNKSLQLCAGSDDAFKDTCSGDSGGPLTIKHPNTTCMLTIAGIVSYGEACLNRTTTKSVYTRVSAYTKWIECQIWNSC